MSLRACTSVIATRCRLALLGGQSTSTANTNASAKATQPGGLARKKAKNMSHNNQALLITGSGFFAVVFPDDAHIPQLAVGTPAEVKKIVMKVPVK